MTRGKNAAASAARREALATAALAAERTESARRIAQLEAEVRELTAEVTRLSGNAVGRAADLAAAQVQQVRDSADAAIAEIQADCEKRILHAFRIITDDEAFRVNIDLLPAVAEALGVAPLALVPGAGRSRTARRNLGKAKHLRAITDLRRQAGVE
jgi:hypothetical protein